MRGKTIALLGLAFKPNTDDMREAPSRVIAYRLLAEGADVRAWDPSRGPTTCSGIELCDSVLDAVRDADAAVIVTEWPELASVATRRDARRDGAAVDRRRPEPPRSRRDTRGGLPLRGHRAPRHASPAQPEAARDPELQA